MSADAHAPYSRWAGPRPDFYSFLVRRKIPYVFLSNTGAKGSQGTQNKLAKVMGFMMQHRPPPLECIHTAAEAQVAYMVSAIPMGSRLFVIAGNSHGSVEDSFWMQVAARQYRAARTHKDKGLASACTCSD